MPFAHPPQLRRFSATQPTRLMQPNRIENPGHSDLLQHAIPPAETGQIVCYKTRTYRESPTPDAIRSLTKAGCNGDSPQPSWRAATRPTSRRNDRPTSNRYRWPTSLRNARPTSSESAEQVALGREEGLRPLRLEQHLVGGLDPQGQHLAPGFERLVLIGAFVEHPGE